LLNILLLLVAVVVAAMAAVAVVQVDLELHLVLELQLALQLQSQLVLVARQSLHRVLRATVLILFFHPLHLLGVDKAVMPRAVLAVLEQQVAQVAAAVVA
jgi:hypothetical protein